MVSDPQAGTLNLGLIGASVCLSSGFHPQSNGQTERANQQLETVLRCVASQNPTSRSQQLPWAEYAINSHILHWSVTLRVINHLCSQIRRERCSPPPLIARDNECGSPPKTFPSRLSPVNSLPASSDPFPSPVISPTAGRLNLPGLSRHLPCQQLLAQKLFLILMLHSFDVFV